MQRRDILGEMEDITGRHHSEFTKAEMAVALVANYAEGRRVTEELISIGDTNWDMSWQGLKDLLTANGFSILLVDKFKPGPYGADPEREEELLIAFDQSRCLLLEAASYGLGGDRPHINIGKVYGEVQAPASVPWRTLSQGLNGCSNGPINPTAEGECRRHFDYDIREGLLSQLTTITLAGWTYAETWTPEEHPRHLWLVDYGQEREAEAIKDYHQRSTFYGRCTNERLARLPKEVRRRIGRLTS